MRAEAGKPKRRWWGFGALCAGQFLVVTDSSVVNVALPEIGLAMGLDTAVLQWVITAFSLALGGTLLVAGRLADRTGHRAVFLAGLVLFTIASVVAGVAADPATLLSARAGQGIAAGLVTPSAMALINFLFREHAQRSKALGIWVLTGASGIAIGVVAGGVLTAQWGWRWIFLTAVPVSLAAIVVTTVAVPAPGRSAERGSPDVLGAVLLVTGLAAVMYAIVQAGERQRTGPVGWGLVSLASGGLLLAGFVLQQRRARQPLADWALFRRRRLLGANLAALTQGTGQAAVLFLCTIYLQENRGWTAMQTGLAFLPYAAAAAAGGPLAARLTGSHGPRAAASTGFTVLTVSFLVLAQLPRTDGYFGLMAFGTVLAGLGVSFTFTALAAAATGDAGSQEGVAAGVFNTAIHVGGALGLAMLTTVMAVAGGGPESARGYAAAFLSGAGIVLAGGLCAMLLPSGRTIGSRAP
ncbi:MFS transporter [Saccharothrix sp. AJ9571]|nr:MFS transporter [Saccharothrix sp. AJ9571]